MERTPSRRTAFGPDPAPVQGHQMPTHCQAQSQALYLARYLRLHAVKALKDAFQMALGNPDAVIADTDFEKACTVVRRDWRSGHACLRERLHDHINAPTLGRKTDRIVQQLGQHFVNSARIASDKGNCLCLVSALISQMQMKRHAIAQRLRDVLLCFGDGFSCQPGDIDGPLIEVHGTRLEVSKLQHLLDQQFQAIAGLLDGRVELTTFLRRKPLPMKQEHTVISFDHRQRRAALLPNGGKKLYNELPCILQGGFRHWSWLQPLMALMGENVFAC